MKQVQNQFYGKVADIPHILPVGSIYVCTDTNQTFAAGRDQIPVEISGIDDATKLELQEVLEFSKQNAKDTTDYFLEYTLEMQQELL